MNFPVIKTQLQRKKQILTDAISYTGTDLEKWPSADTVSDIESEDSVPQPSTSAEKSDVAANKEAKK